MRGKKLSGKLKKRGVKIGAEHKKPPLIKQRHKKTRRSQKAA